MKLQGLLPPSDKTRGAPSYANQSELRTGKLPRHVLCQSLATPLECLLQFALRERVQISVGNPTNSNGPINFPIDRSRYRSVGTKYRF